MESSTRHLDVGNNLSCSDEGVIHLGPLEISDPRVLHHSEDKFTSLSIRGLECRVVAAPGLLYHLFLGANQCHVIVVNRCVINSRLAWSWERGIVFLCVGCRVLYDPDKVMYPIFLVVRDDTENL